MSAILSEEIFDRKYKPIPNQTDYGLVWDYDQIPKDTPLNRVWSITEDGETGNEWLSPGYCIVNNMGYIITEVPWEDEDISVLWLDREDFDND